MKNPILSEVEVAIVTPVVPLSTLVIPVSASAAEARLMATDVVPIFIVWLFAAKVAELPGNVYVCPEVPEKRYAAYAGAALVPPEIKGEPAATSASLPYAVVYEATAKSPIACDAKVQLLPELVARVEVADGKV